MSRSMLGFLQYILNEAQYLMDRIKRVTKTDFLRDETLKRAFVRSLEIIGEATKQIPDEFMEKYRHIEWRAMAGMRDRLIHDYLGVDYDIVWDVVTTKVPALQHEIKQIIQKENRR